jgi:hypothetical protein
LFALIHTERGISVYAVPEGREPFYLLRAYLIIAYNATGMNAVRSS